MVKPQQLVSKQSNLQKTTPDQMDLSQEVRILNSMTLSEKSFLSGALQAGLSLSQSLRMLQTHAPLQMELLSTSDTYSNKENLEMNLPLPTCYRQRMTG